jgi:4,5-dihydroxyphthalate decarboxylase
MTVDVHMVIRNYDQITAILAGDVTVSGVNLHLDRVTPIAEFAGNRSFDVGETSFAGYIRGLVSGNRDIVGLPVFVTRGFRHRCFFVQRDSAITTVSDLANKRIGTNGWPDTGNTWSRAILRREGVDLNSIDWVIGHIDGIVDQIFGHRVTAPPDLPNVRLAPEDHTLQEMLLTGDLDALMIPWPPQEFHLPDSRVRRLFADYRQAEHDYARAVGYWPAHHLIGVRREFLDQHPDAVRSLYSALDESRTLMEQRRWALADTTPWLLAELEETEAVLGKNWQKYGVEANSTMIAALCSELNEQGITDNLIDPDSLFEDFLNLMAT